jgi:hypothetical protein
MIAVDAALELVEAARQGNFAEQGELEGAAS